jgi:hypothetical protein
MSMHTCWRRGTEQATGPFPGVSRGPPQLFGALLFGPASLTSALLSEAPPPHTMHHCHWDLRPVAETAVVLAPKRVTTVTSKDLPHCGAQGTLEDGSAAAAPIGYRTTGWRGGSAHGPHRGMAAISPRSPGGRKQAGRSRALSISTSIDSPTKSASSMSSKREEQRGPARWELRALPATSALLLALITYGVMQERIMTHPYGPAHDTFPSSLLLVFVNRLLTVVVAGATLLATGGHSSTGQSPAAYNYVGVSCANVLATASQFEALKCGRFLSLLVPRCVQPPTSRPV